MVLTYLIGALIALAAYICYGYYTKLQYWQKRGVAHPKPILIFGNSLSVLLRKCSINDMCEEAYFKFYKEKLVGLFDFHTPTLIIKDPSLLEKILVKDFQHFTDHSLDNRSGDLFSYGLFQMSGTRWKSVRYKMSPTFTSGKLKIMFDEMINCSKEMIKLVNNNVGKDFEMKNALSVYSLDIIAHAVFGMEFSNDEKKEEFIKMCASIFNTSPLQFLHLYLLIHLPKLANKLGVTFASKKIDQYFKRIIFDAFEQRTANKQDRKDYLQLLLKLKEKGSIEVKTKDKDDAYLLMDGEQSADKIEITNELLAGQAFQFITAGLDPVYLTMMYTMYELAKNPEIQDRVRKEVKEVVAKNDGYTYQAIKEMEYLEQCIQESLRLHPIAPLIFRKCTKDYATDEGVLIEKGLHLFIPVAAIHKDPAYYPNPEVYNPDRFSPSEKTHNFTFLAFGNGPRICLGIRFATIVMKLGLANIIENFNFKLSANSKEPLEYNKLAFLTVTTNQILFNLTPVSGDV